MRWSHGTFEVEGDAAWLVCENETNYTRLFGLPGTGSAKDGINDAVVLGRDEGLRRGRHRHQMRRAPCVASAGTGVRDAARPSLFRPSDAVPGFASFDGVLASRRAEADAFYDALQADMTDPDAKLVQRQAFAGLLWSKQAYIYDVRRWLRGDPGQPPPPRQGRYPQRRMAPSRRSRRDLDARYLGVSLVRRLGSGVSLRRLHSDRPGFRQAAAPASDQRTLRAPERAAPRLRMGVW